MESVTASDGNVLFIDSMPVTVVNNVDGTINYMQVSEEGKTYRQTFTYSSGLLTAVSNWVKQ